MNSLAVSPPSPFSPAAIAGGAALTGLGLGLGLTDSSITYGRSSPWTVSGGDRRVDPGGGKDGDGSGELVAVLQAEIRRLEELLDACPWANADATAAANATAADDDVDVTATGTGTGTGTVGSGIADGMGVASRLAAVLRAAGQGQAADQEACRQLRVRQ